MSLETTKEPAPHPIPPHNRELIESLAAYRTSHGFSTKELGRQLGVDAGTVSKYLNGKYTGDVPKLESVISDVLKAAKTKISVSGELFETAVSRQIGGALETIRKTGDVGLITGEAGLGKTCGIHIYQRTTPSAVAVFVTPWSSSAQRAEMALFETLETNRWSGNTPRADFIKDRFKDSNRLIIVDDAHLLTMQALKSFFWLHRHTGCPLGLIANAELLDMIRTNAQMYSCVGLRTEIKMDRDEQVRETTRALLKLHAGDIADEIEDLAVQVVARDGHCRALVKEIKLAYELRSTIAKLAEPREAFKAAHGKLVRGYKLEDVK